MVDNVYPFRKWHFWAVKPQPAQAHIAQYITDEVLERLENGNSFSFMSDGQVLGCFGWVEIYPHRALLWGYISKDAGAKIVKGTRIIKTMLNGLQYARIDMEVDCDFAEGHRFAKLIGMQCEGERLRKAGQYGQDVAVYSMIRGD